MGRVRVGGDRSTRHLEHLASRTRPGSAHGFPLARIRARFLAVAYAGMAGRRQPSQERWVFLDRQPVEELDSR